MNDYRILEIKEIISETDTIKTFIFDWEMEGNRIPKPGQFVMVWSFLRKKDEKPMSISKIDENNNQIAITLKNVGEFTNDLHNLTVGDKLGIRGPYGNGFEMEGDNILAIGGGVGMAPISCFVDQATDNGSNVDIVSASVTKNELLFLDRMKNSGANIFTCTDDGTCGFEGFATHRTIDLLESRSYDMAVVCGPEIMMKEIFNILEAKQIPAQYSMERYMKCAMGVCGQCCVDNTGWRICVEGPIFSTEDLKKITEFGKYHRDASGIKETF
ncbi:dihydroorotate dehydrogenase electron transfer subunit [Methanobrevibacter cuticularis]|uniref:dihydroorotate dehydrogenase electron transfer subunit n=1 Tax=Methanobrevibacter cuticularis TaxID=47311 RepID=UPI00082A53D2|nr:dihydroorotate dehydrogenase electron transfer subunit [Methanobrevibacter cuticularis]